MNETLSPDDWTITSGPTIEGEVYKKGLTTEDYHIIDDNYMDACHVSSFILHKAFAKIGKFHIKSLSGIKEKLLFRQKCVDDMLRITVDSGKSELLVKFDEDLSLSFNMGKVERKVGKHRLDIHPSH